MWLSGCWRKEKFFTRNVTGLCTPLYFILRPPKHCFVFFLSFSSPIEVNFSILGMTTRPWKFVDLAHNVLALVVQKADNAIHRISHYPVDSVVCVQHYFFALFPLCITCASRSPRFHLSQNTQKSYACSACCVSTTEPIAQGENWKVKTIVNTDRTVFQKKESSHLVYT